ncbi:hypothetical protein XELAEV_18033355mg [Xenopus laevis]|uniref:Uncharacterized protein n=1 Tax=Xenopus laevis TaxID=8355 RepID=A0A974CJ41_XENLA|nr:hypothetical protein XELAEV_18033355mg [Xenopus laevis]
MTASVNGDQHAASGMNAWLRCPPPSSYATTDNMAVVMAVNNLTSSSHQVLCLLKYLVLCTFTCLQLNVHLRAKHVPGCTIDIADFQWVRVRHLVPGAAIQGERCPGMFELDSEIEDNGDDSAKLGLLAQQLYWEFGRGISAKLVSENKQGSGGIQAGDVWEVPEVLTILIQGSKTDKEGRGLTIPLRRASGCRTCPVKCSWDYRAIRPYGMGAYLIHQNGTNLSCFQFIMLFKKALIGLGLSVKEYGSHSFRIRAATESVLWGLEPNEVRRIGRWESDRFKFYVRPAWVEVVGGVTGQQTSCAIWLVGHSHIARAEKRAMVRHDGNQVGLHRSQRDFTGSAKGFPKSKMGRPSILVVHCGGNDLGHCPMKSRISEGIL